MAAVCGRRKPGRYTPFLAATFDSAEESQESRCGDHPSAIKHRCRSRESITRDKLGNDETNSALRTRAWRPAPCRPLTPRELKSSFGLKKHDLEDAKPTPEKHSLGEHAPTPTKTPHHTTTPNTTPNHQNPPPRRPTRPTPKVRLNAIRTARMSFGEQTTWK